MVSMGYGEWAGVRVHVPRNSLHGFAVGYRTGRQEEMSRHD